MKNVKIIVGNLELTVSQVKGGDFVCATKSVIAFAPVYYKAIWNAIEQTPADRRSKDKALELAMYYTKRAIAAQA